MNSYLEQQLSSIPELEVGKIVTGTVVQSNDDVVLVDIGYKSEGRISTDEFIESPSVGDLVKVRILRIDDGRGQVIVSKREAEAEEKHAELRNAAAEHTPVLGKFIKVIKGGYEVDLGATYLGFCPGSKADIEKVENPESLIGKTDYFLIEKFHATNRYKSVVSRRGYLETIAAGNREEFFKTVQIGDVVQGEVRSITTFGAFIDLGGFDGLLHINDMSWGHVAKAKDFVKKGQILLLRLITIDPETKRIGLSLKHMTPDPWNTFEEKYHVGDVITKTVSKIADFGCFVELEPGIEGLVHVSELSWTRRITKPSEVVKVGDTVSAMILGYDIDKRKVSLGLKQLQENPWDTIAERYPVGKILTGKVVKITDVGAYINLEDGIDGFLHEDDVTWKKDKKKISAYYKTGDSVEVAVTKVDPLLKRIRLSVKQLEENPWNTLKTSYPRNSVISGKVSSVIDDGIFVKVIGDIEGFISKYDLVGPNEEYTDKVLESYKDKIGEEITAVVTDINLRDQKLTLSIKEKIKRNEAGELSKYLASSPDDEKYNPFAVLSDIGKNGK